MFDLHLLIRIHFNFNNNYYIHYIQLLLYIKMYTTYCLAHNLYSTLLPSIASL